MTHAYVLGRFPPPLDGQAIATERLAAMLASRYDVTRVNTEQSDGRVRELSFNGSRALHFLKLRRRLRSVLASHRSSVVLWAAVSPATLGHVRDRLIVTSATTRQQPIIAVVHRGDFQTLFERRLTRSSARRMVEQIETFVFLTNHLSESCALWIPAEKRTVIPNTIDDDLIATDEEVAAKWKRRQETDTLQMLFVANMIAEKGYLDVLEAVAKLIRSGHAIYLNMAGEWMSDRDREAFLTIVSKLGIDGQVSHFGSITNRLTLRRLYLDSHVFVLPTYYATEAQPLSIIEALNAGTPVITTRHAGIPEMVRADREGVFVEARQPDSIVAAIKALDSYSTWSRMSKSARSRFLETYSPSVVREDWIRLIESVRGTEPSASRPSDRW